ncbi:hypothetical protein RIF29_14087 [Crotalaria pallida]|uniref:Uncharacterized protein n=1 Tax=Crotalaria pallida TaxID=3830 RepID=A0AAN9IHX5_CROPI
MEAESNVQRKRGASPNDNLGIGGCNFMIFESYSLIVIFRKVGYFNLRKCLRRLCMSCLLNVLKSRFRLRVNFLKHTN